VKPVKSKEEVAEWVAGMLVRQFEVPAAAIELDAHLFEDLDLDSIDAIDFLVTLEEAGGLRVDEDELRALRYFRDLVELVHGKLQPQ
jgi:acyl carrier protein